METEDRQAQPGVVDEDGYQVVIEDFLVTRYGVVVAITVTGTDEDYSPSLNWVKARDPASSNISLIDPLGGEYYFPSSTTLKGKLMPNVPRTGVVMFQPLQKATAALQLRLSDVKLRKARGAKENLLFTLAASDLQAATQAAVDAGTLSGELIPELEKRVRAEVSKLKRQAEATQADLDEQLRARQEARRNQEILFAVVLVGLVIAAFFVGAFD